MRERHVPSRPAASRKRDADDLGRHSCWRVGEDPQGEPAGCFQLAYDRVEGFSVAYEAVVAAGVLGGGRVFHHQRSEAELREELIARLSGRPAVAERLDVEL